LSNKGWLGFYLLGKEEKMKKVIVMLVAVLLLPGIALAGKPVKVDLQAMIEKEIADREAADTVLQSNITAEEAARQGGDAALQCQVDTLQGLIDDIYNSNRFGNILVYDANDQFLGILLSSDPDEVYSTPHIVAEIFIPSVNIATIHLQS
jgi:hypothetical protein